MSDQELAERVRAKVKQLMDAIDDAVQAGLVVRIVEEESFGHDIRNNNLAGARINIWRDL